MRRVFSTAMPAVLAAEVRQSKRRRRAAVDGEAFVSTPLCEAICLAHGNLPPQYPDDVLRGRHASCHRVSLDSRTAAAIAGSGGRMDGTAWQCSHPPPSARKTQQLVDHVCAVLSDLPSTIVAVYAGSAQLRDRSYSGGGS